MKKKSKTSKGPVILLVLGVVIALGGFTIVPAVYGENPVVIPLGLLCLVVGIIVALIGVKGLSGGTSKKKARKR